MPNIKICGKTGTAQVASSDKTKGAKLRSALANNAWFVAFAPREKPEIAVVALFENGEESYNAVPIVRDVIKAYFDKRNREKGNLNARLGPFTPPPLISARPFAILPLPLRKDLLP